MAQKKVVKNELSPIDDDLHLINNDSKQTFMSTRQGDPMMHDTEGNEMEILL